MSKSTDLFKWPVLVVVLAQLFAFVPSNAFERMRTRNYNYDRDDFYQFSDNTFVVTNQQRVPNSKLKFSIHNVNVVKVITGSEPSSMDILNYRRYSMKIQLNTSMSDGHSPKKNSVYYDYNFKNDDSFNQTILFKPIFEMDFSKYEFTWNRFQNSSRADQEVCFHYAFNNASMFTTFTELYQHWPMNGSTLNESSKSFTTGQFGSIVENLFLFSNGFAIVVNQTVPLSIRRDFNQTDPLLCLSTEGNSMDKFDAIKFDLYIDYCDRWVSTCRDRENNIRLLYQNVTQTFHNIKTSKEIPDADIFTNPIWTVWNDRNVSGQNAVLEFAWAVSGIYDFKSSLLEISLGWEKFKGDWSFDVDKFHDPQKMITKLHNLGHRVSLAMHPFISENSTNFEKFNYVLAKDQTGQTIITQQNLGVLDFSRNGVTKWFVESLKNLKSEFKIDTYNFFGGELSLYGNNYWFANKTVQNDPNLITSRYAEASSKLGKCVQVQSTHKLQNLPIFLRVDKPANWNGLRSLIPTVLTMSIAGYSFVVPSLSIDQSQQLPFEELYIRWVQATALMPVMKFTIPPWAYNNQSTVNIVRKFVDLHEEYAPEIIELAKSVTQDGTPIIRPMWYADADDVATFTIDDQFMLGDDIIVAPVLQDGQRERSVYIPKGIWLDSNGKAFKGPKHFQVDAPLDQLIHFKLFDSN